MSVTGVPGQGPLRVGVAISDVSAGLYLAVGILIALHKRHRTGRGQWVQTSLLEAMIGMMDFQAARWTIARDVPGQEGNHHPTETPMGCFPTADGHVNIAAYGGRLWETFCRVAGLQDLLADERFATRAARSVNRAALNEIIARQLTTRSTADWIEELNEAGVPAGPVYTVDEVFADQQTRHLDLVQPVEHPVLGELNLIRSPVSLSSVPRTIRRASPEAGEHTDEVLAGLGRSANEIAALHREGVVE
jgi:formyl-CoA transferase